MRDKATVKPTANGKWLVTRPRLGFGGPELQPVDSQAEGIAWLEQATKPRGASAGCERAHQHVDGVGTVPGWATVNPYRYRGRW